MEADVHSLLIWCFKAGESLEKIAALFILLNNVLFS